MFRVIILLCLISSCSRMSNQHAEDLLVCGDDLVQGQEYFTVWSANKNQMTSNFEIIDLESQIRLPLITKNGCVSKPSSGTFLVRSLGSEEARVLNVKAVKNRDQIELLDYSRDSFSVECAEKSRTVGPSFSAANILKVNVQENLQPAIKLEYEIKNQVESRTALALQNATGLNLMSGLNEEKIYEFKFTVTNLLKMRSSQSLCRFDLDQTAPKADILLNSRKPSERIEVHGTSAIPVGVIDGLAFQADHDTSVIRYCLVKLNDDFETLESEAGKIWKATLQKSDCQGEIPQETQPSAPILTDVKSHLWALRFQAIDAVGNISPYQTQLILIMNRDSQRLIRDNAALANMSKASLKTVEYALMSENLRLQMPTRYERLLTKEETLSALLRAYYQESVAVVLPRTPGDAFITHALNSKGTQLVSASENYENLKLINIETGKESWVVKSGLFISSMSFTSDDQYIVVLDSSGTIALFDAGNGAPVRTIVKETQAYALLGLNTDGSLIITDGANGIQSRNMFNGELVYSIPSSVDLDKAAALSPDGRILALAGADGTLRLWDATNGQLLHAIQTPASSPLKISWSLNNKALGVLYSDKEVPDQKTVALYRLNQDKWQSGPTWTEKEARTLVLSPDGSQVFVAHDSGEVKTRLADSPEHVVKVLKEQSNAVVSLFASPDGRKLITYSEDDKIRIWNLSIIQEGRTLSLLADDRITAVIFATDRKKVIAATAENGVVIWDIESGNILKTLVEQNAEFKSKLAISQDGKTLMLKGDRDIQLWDLESGQGFRKFSLSNADKFNSAALSPNGRFVVTGMFNSRDLLIWDRAVEEPPRRLKVNTNINSVAIDPTGQLIASSGLDRAIRIWDFTTGTLLQTLDGHQTSAQHLKFSNDSLRLTSVDWYSLKVWNMSTRLPTFELKGQFQGQEFLDMNSTASRIIAGGKSGITLLDLAWENALDIPMLNFQGTLAMAEDGSSFATALRDGKIGLWDLSHDPIRHNLCLRLQNYLAPELCSL